MSSTKFPKTKMMATGYDCDQVDEFFAQARKAYEGGIPAEQFSAAQVRSVHFDLIRGGYHTTLVDQALDRLEAAFMKRDRANNVAVNGAAAWMEHVAQRATTLYPRMLRPAGERFRHPEKGVKGYYVEEVDQLVDRLAAFFDNDQPITVEELRTVTFRATKGRKAYDEAVVDAYIARAIEVLLAVE